MGLGKNTNSVQAVEVKNVEVALALVFMTSSH
jgi:hypothetical protein